MNKLTKLSIEIMPDELWLEIFSYTSQLDLYNIWWNLNSHINAILRSVPIGVYIKSNDTSDSENILRHFSLQTICLKDERWDNNSYALSKTIDLCSLSNLRSLYLTQCHAETLEQINSLHHLNRLSLPCGSAWNFFERFVIGEEWKQYFPHLHSIGRIWIGYEKPRDPSSSVTINTTIRHIHLVVPSCSSSIDWIQQLPELRSISVNYLNNVGNFGSSCYVSAKICRGPSDRVTSISAKMSSSSQSYSQTNLTLMNLAPRIYHLRIDFDGACNFAELARALKGCPILTRIQITVKYYADNFDFDSVQQLSPFFGALKFGNVCRETGKPVIVIE